MVWLVVASAVASAIGAYYYLRIVFFMYFGEETEALDKSNSPMLGGFLTASAVLMLLGVVYTFGIEGSAGAAARCSPRLIRRSESDGPASRSPLA